MISISLYSINEGSITWYVKQDAIFFFDGQACEGTAVIWILDRIYKMLNCEPFLDFRWDRIVPVEMRVFDPELSHHNLHPDEWYIFLMSPSIATSFSLNLATWCDEKQIKTPLEKMTIGQIDTNLRRFYAEARKKTGEPYSRSSLVGFRHSIERYLNFPPHQRNLKISTDPRFNSFASVKDLVVQKMGVYAKDVRAKRLANTVTTVVAALEKLPAKTRLEEQRDLTRIERLVSTQLEVERPVERDLQLSGLRN
ncbi:hypothetical protein QZH41_005200 [Actinostola sp. cb2023]|nr:hypothetical protein QZH41_005200 [Actinostola sp. cb2023]